MIKSYSMEELKSSSPSRGVVILVEDEEDDIFKQVSLSDKEFREVVKIINKGKIGFVLNTFEDKYRLEEIDEL